MRKFEVRACTRISALGSAEWRQHRDEGTGNVHIPSPRSVQGTQRRLGSGAAFSVFLLY